jgi:hypothetical protein
MVALYVWERAHHLEEGLRELVLGHPEVELQRERCQVGPKDAS